MKKQSKKNREGSNLDPSSFVIEYRYTEKSSFRITLDLLERLLEQSKNSNKKPLFILGIKKDEENIYELKCNINIIRKDVKIK